MSTNKIPQPFSMFNCGELSGGVMVWNQPTRKSDNCSAGISTPNDEVSVTSVGSGLIEPSYMLPE
jgi:hypothetical protein